MDPITAIKGLEKEITRINLQGTSSFHSVNRLQDENRLGVDIEIIKQIQKIKPKIQLFYEDRSEIKASGTRLYLQRSSKNSSDRTVASYAMEEVSTPKRASV